MCNFWVGGYARNRCKMASGAIERVVKCLNGHETMTNLRARLELLIALALVTIFTVHLLWYPTYGEHFARLGDQHAAKTIRQWHLWNPVFVVGLVTGWGILYSILRRSGDRTRIIAVVASASVVLAIIVFELLLIVAYGFLRYSLFHARVRY